MKFEKGQLVMLYAGRGDPDYLTRRFGACIVLGKAPVARFPVYPDTVEEMYMVWSIKLQRKTKMAERDLSPVHPQEDESEV